MTPSPSRNVLITGASGYLGGSLFAQLATSNLTGYDKLFALVRNDEQKKAVSQYGAEPLSFNIKDEEAVSDAVLENNITVVFYLIDAFDHVGQVNFIKALGELKRRTGRDVHFLHTSGAKVFSSHAGAPTERVLYDNDKNLYDVQKKQTLDDSLLQKPSNTNCIVIEKASEHDVRAYIFVPCIVYGPGEGFGNPISIQTADIVKAAKASGRVYSVTSGRPTWPVCHLSDNTSLYMQLLRSILNGEDIGHGKEGYYLAASGSVAWGDIYAAVAKALKARGVIDDDAIVSADSAALQRMSEGLQTDPSLVEMRIGGQCSLTARNGPQIGWTPKYPAEDILGAADAEVKLVLETLGRQ